MDFDRRLRILKKAIDRLDHTLELERDMRELTDDLHHSDRTSIMHNWQLLKQVRQFFEMEIAIVSIKSGNLEKPE